MPQEIKNTLDFKNVGKIVNLPDGVDPQDAATVHQLATGSGTAAWGGITGSLSSQTDLQSALDAKENIITAGSTSQYWRGDKTWQDFNSTVLSATLAGISIAGGAVTSSDGVLTAFGKLQNQINGVLGGATYQGVWNASSNTPSLAAGTGTKGYYYVVSVNGSTNLDGITDWNVGDWAIFNGTTWDKVDNTDAVSSVNGTIGAISLAGTANRISVSGTTFDIASTYAGQSSINTVGTIATGVWNGTAIGSTYGGTGLTSYAKGDVLIATGTNTVGVINAPTTDGYVFTYDLASGLPMWKASGGGGGWGLTGNAGTVAGTNFIGTTDNIDIVFKRNNTQVVRIFSDSLFLLGSGGGVTTPSNAFFSGFNAGQNATGASFSIFIGGTAGYGATSASNSNFLGQQAGANASGAYNSNFVGPYAGYSASGAYASNFFGNRAGYSATNAHGSNFMGNGAGQNATTAPYSNFYGDTAGSGATNASQANIFGRNAGLNAYNASDSNFFGAFAGNGATGASSSNFFGKNAGNGATGASYSNFFGYNVGSNLTHTIIGSNNIVIGTNITTPAANSANTFNIGNVLYGVNTYGNTASNPSKLAQTTGRVSIGTTTADASAILDLTSITMGLLPPRMTTTQKTSITSPAEGLVLYDNVLHKLCVYTGSAWETITSA